MCNGAAVSLNNAHIARVKRVQCKRNGLPTRDAGDRCPAHCSGMLVFSESDVLDRRGFAATALAWLARNGPDIEAATPPP